MDDVDDEEVEGDGESAGANVGSANAGSESQQEATTSGQGKKRKSVVASESQLEAQMSAALIKFDTDTKKTDEDELFMLSLVPMLKAMPLEKKEYAKLQVHQVLYNIRFNVMGMPMQNPMGNVNSGISMPNFNMQQQHGSSMLQLLQQPSPTAVSDVLASVNSFV